MPRRSSHPADDHVIGALARLILHSAVSVLFAVAWMGDLESFQRAELGVQVASLLSLIGLIGLWHSRLIQWLVEPVAAAQSLSGPIRETLNSMPEGLMVTDKHHRITMANETLLFAMGLSSDQVIGKRAESLPWVISEGTFQCDLPWMQLGSSAQWKQEQLMRYRVPGGSEKFFSINASPVLGDENTHEGSVLTLRDVTQLETRRADLQCMLIKLRSSHDEVQSQNRELQILANQDSLTGCLNRRAFFDVFNRAFARATDQGDAIACLMIDIDHFKQVNDHYGHQVGDDVLKAVSAVLRQNFPAPSAVGRYGGEEFCVMMPCVCLTEAADIAEMVRCQVEGIQFWNQPSLQLSASFGISGLRDGIASMEDMIRQADECLYQAKRSGRNQVVHRDLFVALAEGAPC